MLGRPTVLDTANKMEAPCHNAGWTVEIVQLHSFWLLAHGLGLYPRISLISPRASL